MRPSAFAPVPSALLASGAPVSPTLGVELTQTSPGSRADIELKTRLGPDMPFSVAGGTDTWEEWTVVHEALVRVGGKLTSCHIGGSHSRACGYEGTDLKGGDWFVSLEFMDGYWYFAIGAASEKRVLALRSMITTLAGEAPILDANAISMSIWTYNAGFDCGNERYGRMPVNPWADVIGNYPGEIGEQLAALATNLPGKEQGGIILFGGVAGTGKTRAIEALCHAWAGQAKLGVVVDSDKMLSSAGYMTDVITSCWADERQVIVAEDVDKMVVAGPKSDETSKLLNIADGLVGRLAGAGTLFILSANLPMDEIASYVTRPGRAAAAIEFRAFSAEEATAWMADHGVEGEAEGEMTLAELFARSRTAEV